MNRAWLKTLRNILVANLCFLAPLWWTLFGWMPDQAKIYMRGRETPGSIVAGGSALIGEELGAWSGGRIYRFYLRRGMDWEKLAFRLPGSSGAEGVERIELQKWKLISMGKPGSGLAKSGSGRADEYVFPDPRFERIGIVPGKITLGLAVLEIMLLVMSWWCAKRYREESWRTLGGAVLGVALTLTLLLHVALPVQSYLANRSAYAFPAGELLVAVAWKFAWTSVLAVAAMGLLVRCFGRCVLGVAFAFAICVYLESGILSNGLASLTGDIWLLLDPKRTLWDAVAWGGVFVAVAALHGFLRKHYGMASLCLMAMVAASMLDTKREKERDKSRLIVDDFVPYETVIQNVSYSTNQNVLVFILDSMEREQAQAVMEDPEAGAELREKFRGFTAYTKNVGALPQTVSAVPNLLTGRYPDATVSPEEFAWSCYGGESALRDYLEKGHDVYVTTPGVGCGFASKRKAGEDDATGRLSVLRQPGNGGEAWSVLDFSRWRWLPFGVKASCSALIGFSNGISGLREWSAYPALAKAGCEFRSNGVFMLVHTMGVHIPVFWNRHGEMLPMEDSSRRGCVEQGIFILKCLADLMDAYRRIGIYDNSLILVLGDHGGGSTGMFSQDIKHGRLPGNARPFLWVKPVESRHEFATSGLPTGHAQVSGLLKAAAKNSLSEPEIQAILEADRRVYRRMALLGAGWTDWIVEKDGTFTIQENSGFRDAGVVRHPLTCGCRYSLDWRQLRNTNVEMSFIGADAGGYPSMLRGTRRMSMEFRVPKTEATYTLELDLYDAEGGTLRFKAEGEGTEWTEFPVQPRGVIGLRDLKSDADGMVKITCERGEGPDVDVAFTALMLEEDK